MFGFKKKIEADNNLYAPVNGTCISIEEVNDQVFSSRMMGDGVAFKLADGKVCAPCDGTLVMIANTKHAFGIQGDNGVEVLIHIGLDTVNLNGEGLKTLVDQGSKVKKGEGIIEVDMKFMEEKEIDLTTPMIVTNGTDLSLTFHHIGDKVSVGEDIVIAKA
ncbi:MAG: PTS glucose transporter subunit IIA [Longicatena sp.]